jgi:hypothetical protein
MADKPDKEDHIHDWSPPHLRQDTPVVRAANKASAKPAAAEEAAEGLEQAVRDGKAEVREIQSAAAKKKAK